MNLADSYDKVVRILREELALEEDDEIHPNGTIKSLGAEDTDYLAIFERMGIRFMDYFDAGADRLTDKGQKALTAIGSELRTRGLPATAERMDDLRTRRLSESLERLSVSDLAVIDVYAQTSQN